MLKHYIKTAFRNFRSNRLIFAGSIVTVFLCVLCISLLFTYVHNELTMDDFHKNEENIFAMTVKQSPESLLELAQASRYFDFEYKNYPEIESLVNIAKYNKGELKFICNESTFSPEGLIADSTFFEVFDFNLSVGDKHTILYNSYAAILTKDFAKKIFGKEDPIGKNIKVISRRENLFTVKGIVESPPSNSSITFDFILSSNNRGFSRSGADFILVNNNFNTDQFSGKIKHIGHIHSQFKNSVAGVMPLKEIYFKSQNIKHKHIFSKSGDKKSLKILFAIIGVIFII